MLIAKLYFKIKPLKAFETKLLKDKLNLFLKIIDVHEHVRENFKYLIVTQE